MATVKLVDPAGREVEVATALLVNRLCLHLGYHPADGLTVDQAVAVLSAEPAPEPVEPPRRPRRNEPPAEPSGEDNPPT
jgi:hypothetical protein